MSNQRKTVAVVDDDPGVRSAIESLLNAYGIAARTFASAEAFLELRDAGEFDCLLLDVHLGGMSGIELRRRLARAGRVVPVIFMTGSDDLAVRDEALNAGCVACLRKPFRPHLLIEAIEQSVPRHEQND